MYCEFKLLSQITDISRKHAAKHEALGVTEKVFLFFFFFSRIYHVYKLYVYVYTKHTKLLHFLLLPFA